MGYPNIPIDYYVLGYKGAFDWLHGATARNIIVFMPPIRTGCPNDAGFDFVNKKAFNVYNPANPFSSSSPTIIPQFNISGIINIPFSGEQICPVCNGLAFIESPASGIVPARIKWVDKEADLEFRGEKAVFPQSDVRIKVTGLNDIYLLDRCDKALIDGFMCRMNEYRIDIGLRDVHTYIYHFNKVS